MPQSDNPSHRHRQHHRDRRHRDSPPGPRPRRLPFNAAELDGSSCSAHFQSYAPIFHSYLEIQKGKDATGLDTKEIRGRWKGFVKRWFAEPTLNKGLLAEGWYDPALLERLKRNDSIRARNDGDIGGSMQQQKSSAQILGDGSADDGSDSEAHIGPDLPSHSTNSLRVTMAGPARPNAQDSRLQREQLIEDAAQRAEVIRYERKQDRKTQREQLDVLAPRAEPGSRERLLEKKREKGDANRAFAIAKTEAGGTMQEIDDTDLMGGGDSDLATLKRKRDEEGRKKSEKELRRESIMRERAEEREQRVREYREKEARTMSSLVELARAKYG